jgi:hypothetical protein
MYRQCTCGTSTWCAIHGNTGKTPYQYETTIPYKEVDGCSLEHAVSSPESINEWIKGRRPAAVSEYVPALVPVFRAVRESDFNDIQAKCANLEKEVAVWQKMYDDQRAKYYGFALSTTESKIDPVRKLYSVKKYLENVYHLSDDLNLNKNAYGTALAIVQKAYQTVTFTDYSDIYDKYNDAALEGRI